jgi:hypothetical protein
VKSDSCHLQFHNSFVNDADQIRSIVVADPHMHVHLVFGHLTFQVNSTMSGAAVSSTSENPQVNKGTLRLVADQDSLDAALRGRTSDLIVVDDAQSCSDDVLYRIIAPLLGIRGSRVFGFAQKKKP